MSASCLGDDEDEARVVGFRVLSDCNGETPCVHTVAFELDDGRERNNKRDAHAILGLYRAGRKELDPHFSPYREPSGPKDE